MVRNENVRLHAADNVAHGKPRFVIVRQQPVRIIEDDRLPAQLGGERLRLGDLAFPVCRNVCPGGGALFARGERERHGSAAVCRARGKQRSAGKLHIADVCADGEDRLAHGFSSFIITAKYRRGVNPASL